MDNISPIERLQIQEIIRQVKGPYQPFKKPVKLRDLIQIMQEVWEEDD
ncbi:hypothetical protein pb186bvf_012392 [Paramecium bursaria]